MVFMGWEVLDDGKGLVVKRGVFVGLRDSL